MKLQHTKQYTIALSIAIFTLVQITLASCERNVKNIPDSNFDITLDELKELISPLPLQIQKNILKSPGRFLEDISQTFNYPRDLLILVDKKHGLPSNYIPADLVSLKHYNVTISKSYLKLRKIVIPDLLAMVKAARKHGIEIVLSSTYRSYAYQKRLYNYYVRTEGRKKADRESAKPGHSQHQLGTAIDFGSITDSFINTSQGRWLIANAWRYGFSLSYPKGEEKITGYRYECWHYRYVGKPAARIIKEYFENSQQLFLEFYNKNINFLKEKYLSKQPDQKKTRVWKLQ